MTLSNGSARCDEYLDLVDHLRADYPPSFDVTHSSKGLIVILVNLEFSADPPPSIPFVQAVLCMRYLKQH